MIKEYSLRQSSFTPKTKSEGQIDSRHKRETNQLHEPKSISSPECDKEITVVTINTK